MYLVDVVLLMLVIVPIALIVYLIWDDYQSHK